MKKFLAGIITLLLLLFSLSAATHAQEDPPADSPLEGEITCNLDVIVQVDDWLSKLSEKFYGDVLAFPAIAQATNAKNAQDDTYTFIEDVDLIEPGWKLCIVGVDVAEQILGFELENAPLANDTPTNLNGPIKVGAAHALSGPLAVQGQSIRNGIDLAVKEINNSTFLGAGILEIIWEDTAGNKTQAVEAFNKLINDDEVIAILGPTLSRSAFAANPIAQAAGVPVIGSSNTASGITSVGNYIFRTNLPEQAVIDNTVQQAQALLALQQVAMIYDSTGPFTELSHQFFEQTLRDQGLEIVATVPLSNGEVDILAQLSELQVLELDAIVLNVGGQRAANIISQARQLGLPQQVRFISGSSISSPTFFEAGGPAINGTISGAAWNINMVSGSNRAFVADYQAEYGSQPNQFAAQAYTAVWALATALRNVDSTNQAALRDALDAIDVIDSPLGLFTFDDNRNADHAPVLQQAADGTWVVLQ